jgi:hypothetical protein
MCHCCLSVQTLYKRKTALRGGRSTSARQDTGVRYTMMSTRLKAGVPGITEQV